MAQGSRCEANFLPDRGGGRLVLPRSTWWRKFDGNRRDLAGKTLALSKVMPTLLDAYELRPSCDGAAVPAPRARMASIAIDIEWDEPPPSSLRGHGPRVWTSEE